MNVFYAAHTVEWYETTFYRPMLSDWCAYEAWQIDGAKDATQRATIREALEAHVAKRKEVLRDVDH